MVVIAPQVHQIPGKMNTAIVSTLSLVLNTHTGAKLSHILLPLRWTVVQSEAAFRSKGTYVTSHTVTPSLASGLCVCALGVAAVLGPEDIY